MKYSTTALVLLFVLFSILFALPTNAQVNASFRGRNVVGSLPRPTYTSDTEGIVVVQVKVDQYGNVTEAIPGAEGTTITDNTLWNAARNAAMKAHFNMDAHAPAVQTGILTYVFKQSAEKDDSLKNNEIEEVFTPVKDIVDAPTGGLYAIKAKFVKTKDRRTLIILVEEDDYIIPVQLVKKDLGAEKRFVALNLQPGDLLTIRGTLSKIEVDLEEYSGLVDAVISDVQHIVQQEPDLQEDASVAIPFKLVDEKPSFMGGDANMFSQWVNSELRYPKEAKNNGIQGRVIVQFTIKADGSVSDVSLLRGVDEALDKEAIRVVSKSPKWKPGSMNGKKVDVRYIFPVIFQMQ